MASMGIKHATASSPCVSPWNARWRYDVFLSFRGEDTRANFTDHLYAALHQRGITIFRDDLNLERGKAIAPELFKAIEESRISVIVFSRSYASSTWCLDEVIKIVQCMNLIGQLVLPIFYDVDPSEVRKQTGKYQEAFDKHEEAFRNNIEKVHKWRAALAEVANLSGWDREDRLESKFIQDIVESITNKLSSTFSLTIEDFVGINSRLFELSSCINIGCNDVRVIGITGMGGIGKTTIARAFYNRTSLLFEGSAFLANVREVSLKGGVLPLQEQLLCEILKAENLRLWNVYEGIEMIKARLRYKRVLIVIDDVDQLNQLKELAGKNDWFGLGSRIIITTRDENLLVRHGVDEIYKPKGLNDDEALQLFSFKAFKNNHPPEDYITLSTMVLEYVNGLPLALEVLGSFLFGKTLNEWKSALARTKENPEKQILDTLQIGYDGLEETEKKIFLDVACFFKGNDKDNITKIWDSCGFYPDIGIRVLIDKSLITITDNNRLWMHDLLQEMGWKLVRQESLGEPGKRSRLWLYKDIYHVLINNSGTEDVEGIALQLPFPKLEEAQLSSKAFSKMRKLRLLLIFHNVPFAHGLEYLSNDLRILKWDEYPFKRLPSSFHPEELIELDMCYSQVEQLWKDVKHFNKLKTINLSHSRNLIKLPDFRGFPNLEKLTLEGCSKLLEIDQSIGVLENLTLLNLKDCKKLASLPKSVYGLKALKTVNLSGCSKLVYRLEELGPAECLEELDISGTAISQPPASFSHFKNLKKLSLRGCKGQLRKARMSILSSFRGKGSNHISLSLPSFSGLSSLMTLDLSNCNLLEESIPSDLSCLCSLSLLNLSGNDFTSLPAIIHRVSNLEYLYLDDCKRLQSLEGLPSNLNFVSAQGCTSLETLPETLDQCSLQSLELVENQGLSHIQFLISLKSLLDFGSCLSFAYIMHLLPEGFLCLREPVEKAPRSDIVVFGSEIPNWFNYQSLGNSISIQLPPVWHDRKWVGFAFCAVYVNRDCSFSNLCNIRFHCSIVMKSYSQKTIDGFCSHTYVLEKCSAENLVDHIWLFYLPRCALLDTDWHGTTKMTRIVEAKLIDLGGKFQVKKCGVRLVYKDDALEFFPVLEQFFSSKENFDFYHQELEKISTGHYLNYDGCDDSRAEFHGESDFGEESQHTD